MRSRRRPRRETIGGIGGIGVRRKATSTPMAQTTMLKGLTVR